MEASAEPLSTPEALYHVLSIQVQPGSLEEKM